jgi:hypothetical protein
MRETSILLYKMAFALLDWQEYSGVCRPWQAVARAAAAALILTGNRLGRI